jgi:hypothetical protein
VIIDTLLKVSAQQAVTVSVVSTSSIDLGLPGGVGTPLKRQIGTGEDVGFGVTFDVAASLTSCTFEIIMATNGALPAGVVSLVTDSRLAADLVAGASLFVPFPMGAPVAGLLRFVGMRYVPTGGAATITVSAFLTTPSVFSVFAASCARAFSV